MILEGIVTTLDELGRTNVAPMGPIVAPDWREFLLRPYQTSQTYRNLKHCGEGVLHVTDDVEMIASAAIGQLKETPAGRLAESVRGWILADACRWYAFRVADLDDREQRTEIRCEVIEGGRQRDFFGFNRAKHAVLEAAILATRIEFLPKEQILEDYKRLASPVQKTAGESERKAFLMLQEYVQSTLADR